MPQPEFYSLAFGDIPVPDYADVLVIPLPQGAPTDPKLWAETIFSQQGMPLWVQGLMAIRQALVPLLGVPVAPKDIFTVSQVVGEEALIAVDDEHLDFRCGVGVSARDRLVRVTTAVRFTGWRGRVYFAPVRYFHSPVVFAMLRKTSRTLSQSPVLHHDSFQMPEDLSTTLKPAPRVAE